MTKTIIVATLSLLLYPSNLFLDINDSGFGCSFDRNVNTVNHNYDYYNLIGLFDAHNISNGKQSVSVGVIDTGIYSHNNLICNIDNNNGNYKAPPYNTQFGDSIGHGTHVAGIIGSTNNSSQETIGICPNINLVSYRQFFPETGYPAGRYLDSDIISTISTASSDNVDILNLSGCGEDYNSYFYSAINSYNGLFVCAAGNNSTNIDNNPRYPAAFTCSNIISVGNSDWQDSIASSSNYGYSSVDLFAPGTNINSTIPGSTSYGYKSGTSMATPFVTGTVALIKSVNPSLTNAEIKTCILDNVDLISSMNSKCVSGGRLNVYKAVKAAIPEIDMGSNSSIQDLSYGEYQFYKIDVDDEMTLRIISTGNLHLTGYLYSEPSASATPVATSHYYGSGNFELFYEITDPGTYYLKVQNNNQYQGSYGIYAEQHSGHSYNLTYDYNNAFTHKSYCACGEYILQSHTFYAGVCVYCGGTLGGIVPLDLNNPIYENVFTDSYINKSNGIIILGPEDFKKLQRGELDV